MAPATGSRPPLLLIHPIGVGLSSRFWDRFIRRWHDDDPGAELLAPDLIGCGDAACSRDPLTPHDWAEPLAALLRGRQDGPAGGGPGPGERNPPAGRAPPPPPAPGRGPGGGGGSRSAQDGADQRSTAGRAMALARPWGMP